MYSETYTLQLQNVSREKIWSVWKDVSHWHEWNPGIEGAKLYGDFEKGSHFTLKPMGRKEVKIDLIEVVPFQKFTDCTHLLGAKLYGCHEFIEEGDFLLFKTTITVKGFLSFFWWKILGKKIVQKLPLQTENLIKYSL
jgi:hypothetical protein